MKDNILYNVLIGIPKFLLVLCVMVLYLIGGVFIGVIIAKYYLWIPLTIWLIVLIAKKLAKLYVKKKLKLT